MKKRVLIIAALLLLFFCTTAQAEAPEIGQLTYLEETPLMYAQCFHLYRYEGGYTLIDIPESGRFLVVPEGAEIPKLTQKDITILQQPLKKIYLAATSAMALFDAVNAVDSIRMTGTRADGWYIEAAADAMNSGKMLFAGRYSEPDYETLLMEDCCLAIESTMIFHTPKVKENLQDFGIPVLVDRSSYEENSLGRTEWIKLYAVLTGKEAEAEAFFAEQAESIQAVVNQPNTGKTVAFFYVNSDGSVVVRNVNDYIPRMIHDGGGVHISPAVSESETGTSISVSMESFYAAALDADYLIYNASIDQPLKNIQELLAKDALFADFKAVKEGNVWCTGKSFYQATDKVSRMIIDINNILNDRTNEGMTFLSPVR